jgi:transposase
VVAYNCKAVGGSSRLFLSSFFATFFLLSFCGSLWNCAKALSFIGFQIVSVIIIKGHMQRPATNQRGLCHAMTILGRSSGAVALTIDAYSDDVSRRLYYRGCGRSKLYVWNHKEDEKHMEPVVALIGMDWADQEHVIYLYDVSTNTVENMTVSQKPEQLHQWIRNLQARYKGARIAVALEQSRGPLIYALMRYDFLLIYPLNPKALSSYRNALRTSGAKDDPADAELILNFLKTHRDRLRVWVPEDKISRQLTILVEFRRKIVADIVAITNRITALLKSYYPQALEMAGQLDTPMACDFIRKWPTLQHLKKAQQPVLRKFYSRHNSRSAQKIENRMALVENAEPLTQDPAMIHSGAVLAGLLARQLQVLLENRAEIDTEIQKVYCLHPDRKLYESLPGAGNVLEPRLAAAMGTNRDKYESAVQLQQFDGTAPVTKRSGKSHKVTRRLARPRFIMQTHVEFAAKSIGYSAWAAACYKAHKDKGTGHHAALRVLAYKWDRIIFRCWKDRKPYDEATYISALIKRNSPLVKLLNVLQPPPAQTSTIPTAAQRSSRRSTQPSWQTSGEIIARMTEQLVEIHAENQKSRDTTTRKND